MPMNEAFQFNRIADFLAWWRDGLLAWLPPSLQMSSRQRAYVECSLGSEQLTFRHVSKQGKTTASQSFEQAALQVDSSPLRRWLKRYADAELVLLVPEALSLSKVLSLPAQARDNLAAIMQFEIDRQTPFSPDHVYSDYHIQAAGSDDRTLSVLLSVVPKQALQSSLALLAQLSLQPVRLLIPSSQGPEEQCQTIALIQDGAQRPSSSWLNLALLGLTVGLLAAVLYRPIAHYDGLTAAMQPALAEAKQQAASVRALQNDNEAMLAQLGYLDERFTSYRYRVAVLSELAQLLPSHTWLERSDMQGQTLTLRGESSAASDLIGLLVDTGHFDEVRFSAPTTHNPRTGKDRFQIEAVMLMETL